MQLAAGPIQLPVPVGLVPPYAFVPLMPAFEGLLYIDLMALMNVVWSVIRVTREE